MSSKAQSKEKFKSKIGGQAVIEGVMMRGIDKAAMACRLPDGTIDLEEWAIKGGKDTPWYRKTPFVRGIFSFLTSLIDGYKCLTRSAEKQMTEDDKEEQTKFEQWLDDKLGDKLGPIITAISMVLGVPLGLLASTKNKWSERLMRGLDTFQAFPLLVLAIAIVSLTGNNLKNVVVAIGLINTPRFMRLVRADALAVRESRYVEAAISMGGSPLRILRRHVLPNVSGIILVQATLAAANAIVVISALSFVGIGVTPPTPSWGAMIRSGSQNIASGSWWMSVFPGVAVVIAVWALNKIADGVQAGIGRSR